MAYNGSEYNNEKGTQGSLLKYVWGKIYDKFVDVSAAITTALANYYTKTEVDAIETALQDSISTEATARTNAINALQAVVDSKTTSAEVGTQITSAINALLNGAGSAVDTLKELGDLIAANQGGDDALLAMVTNLTTIVGTKATQASVDALVTSTTALQNALANVYTKTESDAAFTTKTKINDLKVIIKAVIDSMASVVATTKKSYLFSSISDSLSNQQTQNGQIVFETQPGQFSYMDKVLEVFSDTGLNLKGYGNIFISASSYESIQSWANITASNLGIGGAGYAVESAKENLDYFVIKTLDPNNPRKSKTRLLLNTTIFDSATLGGQFRMLYENNSQETTITNTQFATAISVLDSYTV